MFQHTFDCILARFSYLCIAILTISIPANAAPLDLAPDAIWTASETVVKVNRDGLVTSLVNRKDPHQMEWVRQDGPPWGLPMSRESGKLVKWSASMPTHATGQANELTFVHGPLTLSLQQRLSSDGRLVERYTFRNHSSQTINLSEGDLGIRVPLPDNYPNAATALTNRTNVHVWTGGTTAWIEAERMNGQAPHLGLVLTEGDVTAYSITDRPWNSNDRGIFVLHPRAMQLHPGESTIIAWTIFWNTGWNDFFRKAAALPNFIRLNAEAYTTFPGEAVHVTADAASSLAKATVLVNGKATTFTTSGRHLELLFNPKVYGDQIVELTVGHQHTNLRAFATTDPLSIIRTRVRFIIDHQQRHAPGEPVDGAFVAYDNETRKQVLELRSDHNAGRERVGMGVLMALYLPLCVDPVLKADITRALNADWRFVSEHLQDAKGQVYTNTDDPEQRLYNYPWVSRLHLALYQATNDPKYLDAFIRTVRAFYRDGGGGSYPIDLPIVDGLAALSGAGRSAEAAEFLTLFSAHADLIVKTGTSLPKEEVNYEQSIVAPACSILLETYLITHNQKYLKAATPFLHALLAFAGKQPDHHLNDIGIRHWDDYWFGKARLYGDTFPHYWSTLTALVLDDLSQTNPSQAKQLRARSQSIIANNLSLFSSDGAASCAYVYPLTINDNPGRFYDAWANDQDWALVHYLLLSSRTASTRSKLAR